VKVLVTGHAGYIGSVLAPFLAEAGHDLTGVDTRLYRDCNLYEETHRIPSIDRDVRDLTVRDLDDYDAVVHLAALSNDPLGNLDRELTFEVNCAATVALARAAREAGVSRFLFASSCSMYGVSGAEDVAEDAPLKPLTPYAESKVRAEEGLAELADERFSPVCLRCATAYGASPRLRIDVVLNNLVGWAFTTGRVRILSDGTPWRPIVHVQDIALLADALLRAPRRLVHGQAFNVGSTAENYQVRDLAEIVRETVPGSSVEYAGSGDPDPRSYRVDFGKLERAFPELRLRWSARSGAAELNDVYRRVGLKLSDLEGARLTRLKELRRLLAAHVLDERLRWQTAAGTAA